MTVRELSAELSKYPPDAEVTLETCDNSVGIDHVAYTPAVFRIAPEQVQIRGTGWDDLPEDDNDEDDEDDEDDEEEYGDEAYDYFDDEDEEDDGE